MRTIKRYSNRKLYDTEDKRYITLDHIAQLIRAGHDVEVVDNVTGEDLTAVTLSQIIFEQQKRGSQTPLGFFTSLIRFGTASPLELLRRSASFPSNALHLIEREVERRLRELVEQGEMAEEQMRRVQADLMARFSDDEPRAREPDRDETLLARLNIPTRSDVQELANRLETLSSRLDELIDASRKRRDKTGDDG
jgi:polyhydroxyalkanoate synthesis repressor PhaR